METRYINKPVMKKDWEALVTGKPVYLADKLPSDLIYCKLLRSKHANAYIKSIDTTKALLVPGVEAIFTYLDVPNKRFTLAGQSHPEPSPKDRYILDRHLRFVGDPVAIIAGTKEAIEKASKLIKVEYEVLDAILDLNEALDNKIIIHDEEDWVSQGWTNADNKRNLAASGIDEHGDLAKAFSECDYIVEETYHTKANNQAMMETFRTFTYLDEYGRLNIVSSTQIVFHVRRIVANALDIPKSRIRVTKPRIGGGFGAKQTAVTEVYPSFVTFMTGKPCCLIYSREEAQIAGSPRHEMQIKVKVGATKDGVIKAVDLYTLSNTGAYGEHAPTTVGLSGHKSIPLYGSVEAFRFKWDVVYTNRMSSGAYRGYGATQGIFALESAVNELAKKMNIDPTVLREKNLVREGQVMKAYYGETANSCSLDKCLAKAKEMMDWDNKYPSRVLENGKVRAVGVAMAMQGSGISGVDVGSAKLSLGDEGIYVLNIAAADMGTGCDTSLAQVAAEVLECDIDNIIVRACDTDTSPYDSGSYASSSAYVTGMAVFKAATELIEKMKLKASEYLNVDVSTLDFDGQKIFNDEVSISVADLGYKVQVSNTNALEVTVSHSSKVSPPPFMVGMAEVEIDKETGHIDLVDYVAVTDCGTPLNSNLVRVQVEGGIAQGIGMALTEDINYSDKGVLRNNSFMQYKLPTRIDIAKIRTAFENSYEPTGPFGAKSIGEVVINTPSPAIFGAVLNATGLAIRELPITAEKIALGLAEKE